MPAHPLPAARPVARPFLKWAGGKSQLLPGFQALYPPALLAGGIKTYCEPFLGSGAVFFDLIQHRQIETAYLCDINEELVLTYRVVQKDAADLIDCLAGLETQYLQLDGEKRKAFYYAQRAAFNEGRCSIDFTRYSRKWLKRAAQLIFLNRTCFNGLYRVNAKGDFNTPAGDYAKPTICDAPNLLAAAAALQQALIRHGDFREALSPIITKEAFIYFDPPYRPLSKTAAFTAYSRFSFGDAAQRELAAHYRQLHEGGSFLMLSNSDPRNTDPEDDFFDRLYEGFTIRRIPARRMINADASKRGAINEIVITNYR